MNKFSHSGKISLITTFIFRRMVIKETRELLLDEIDEILKTFNISVEDLKKENIFLFKSDKVAFENYDSILKNRIEVIEDYNQQNSDIILNIGKILKKEKFLEISAPLFENIDYSSYLNTLSISGKISITEKGFEFGENIDYTNKLKKLIKNYKLKEKFIRPE